MLDDKTHDAVARGVNIRQRLRGVRERIPQEHHAVLDAAMDFASRQKWNEAKASIIEILIAISTDDDDLWAALVDALGGVNETTTVDEIARYVRDARSRKNAP